MGNKLKKTFNGVSSYYQGSVLSINGQSIVQTGEGRAVKYGSGNWAYEYDLKDHLGNTRVSFAADNAQISVLQTKDYYPFGMEMTNGYVTSGTPTKYLYNGKELQDEGGLDWYDYGARFYDPTIGRWHSVDPLAENSRKWSPYSYCYNNPLRFIDPDGMSVDNFVFDENGYFKKIEKNDQPDKLVVENTKTGNRNNYEFADPVNDPKSIKNGDIKKVEFVGDKAISEVLNESGVNSKVNQENKYKFILNESNASYIDSKGKMDYLVTAKPTIDGIKQEISADKLYITGAVAHNSNNFGNFLWGAGANKLGFYGWVAKIGAHIHSLTDQHYKQLDSKDDQYSIGLGYEWSNSHK